MTKGDILRNNLLYHWNELSFKEQTWLMEHVVLGRENITIHLDDDSLEYGEELIARLSTKILPNI